MRLCAASPTLYRTFWALLLHKHHAEYSGHSTTAQHFHLVLALQVLGARHCGESGSRRESRRSGHARGQRRNGSRGRILEGRNTSTTLVQVVVVSIRVVVVRVHDLINQVSHTV